MLRYGLWAASPVEPSVGFSVNLLNLLHLLTLECAVSVKGFMQMLRWKNDWTELQVSRLLLRWNSKFYSLVFITVNRKGSLSNSRDTSGARWRPMLAR